MTSFNIIYKIYFSSPLFPCDSKMGNLLQYLEQVTSDSHHTLNPVNIFQYQAIGESYQLIHMCELTFTKFFCLLI